MPSLSVIADVHAQGSFEPVCAGTSTSPRRVKVLLLAVGLGVGGTEEHILQLATRLRRERFEITVCALKDDDVIGRELRKRGVMFVSLGGKGKLDVRVLMKLYRLVSRERPQVIHAFLLWANMAARIVGRILRGPRVISSYHDVMVTEGWLSRMIDRLTTGWTDSIVCCSEAVRRSVFSQIGGEKAQYMTIPFGVDVERFSGVASAKRAELGLQEGMPVLGTVCRLVEPKKGLRVLLEALASLKGGAASPPCQLLIIGDGPASDSLRALSERLGIAPWVVFAGVRRDIPHLLPLMQIFVLPSLYEGFGIAILEALAAARPVVATAVDGIPEFVSHGQTGLLVPPGEPAALAAAIRTLLDHPEQAELMGARGQEHVRGEFGIESIVRQHERLYETCVS